LCTAEGELYALVLPEVGNSPNSVVVVLPPGGNFLSCGFVEKKQFMAIGSNTLVVDDWVFDLSEAGLWAVEDLHDGLSRGKMRENFFILKRQMAGKGYPEGLGGLLADRNPDVYLVKAAAKVLPQLYEAIRSLDQVGVYRSAQSLVGLGPGLTPSGDDFLSGFMLSLFWGTRALAIDMKGILQCNQEIVRAAKGRTNLISYTQLLYAAKGQGAEHIYRLIKALYYGENGEELKEAINQVLKLGSTSGSDVIAGIGLAMEFILVEETIYHERSAQIWL
jgi:hypothetical protein